MKLRNLASLTALATLLLFAGCRSTEPAESSEMNRMMSAQTKMLREQMQAGGATVKQLREFDRATAEMSKSMRQMERQMRALAQ